MIYCKKEAMPQKKKKLMQFFLLETYTYLEIMSTTVG